MGPGRIFNPSRTFSAPIRRYSTAPRPFVSGGFVRSPHVFAAQSRGGVISRGRAVVRVGPRVGSRGVFVAPFRFNRPFFTFRPRFSIGFGIFVGYPVAYSYPFYYGYPYAYDPYYPYDRYAPYPYPYPYPAYGPPPGYGYPPPGYGYSAPYPQSAYPPAGYPPAGAPQSGYYDQQQDPPQGSIIARPGTASGGISLEISPSTAEVFIDAQFVGRVADLGPTTQPLAITPGRHHVEVRASGYQTLSMDIDIVAGQVIPYQGQLQPIR
jgi:PEGA domain-containing protein